MADSEAAPSRLMRTVAALIGDARGHVLRVAERGSAHFIQPGGKCAAGEAARPS